MYKFFSFFYILLCICPHNAFDLTKISCVFLFFKAFRYKLKSNVCEKKTKIWSHKNQDNFWVKYIRVYSILIELPETQQIIIIVEFT